MNRNGKEPPSNGSPGLESSLLDTLRQRYLDLFEFAPDGCLVTDASGVVLEANRAAAALLKCSKEYLVGKPLAFFMTGEYRPLFYRRLALPKASASVDQWEARMGLPRAEPRDVLVVMAALLTESGRAAGYRWLLRDVSQTRRTERDLRSAQQLFDSLVNAAEASILVVDADGLVMRSNPYVQIVSGYGPQQLAGRRWCELLVEPQDQPAAQQLLREALIDGVAKSGVLGFTSREGPRRAAAWSARALADGPAAAVLLGYDVTDLQEAQRRTLQTERLAAIGQTAAGLAHEGRNALQRSQACLSMLELRLRGQPEALDLLARAQAAQDDLHRLFEDIRSFAAPLQVHRTAVDLAAVWREAWADLAALHPHPGAELREDASAVDLSVDADRFQLKRVFLNLFDNALTAASPARVVIRCAAVRLGGRDALQVRLRDNGPGFPPATRHKLFEPFNTTKTQGTGLGLAICRRLIEVHGGRIEAGAEGPGAEVILTLPRRAP
jgi:PAS domain S-box-containing protein